MLLSLTTFAVYGVYSLTRYRQYLTAGYDLGIFDQAVRAYSQFRAPLVALKGENYNILGDHFHPIIATLAPLYWIWDDPRTLLLAQAALVAVSCLPLWRYARRRFSAALSAGLVVGYALGWPIQGMADFDFHEIAFALPLLAWALDAMDRRRDSELFIACGLLLLVREDMGAVLLLIGILRLWRNRPRWPGMAIAGLGVATFAALVIVVIPHFAGGSYQYWDYSGLGAGAGDALRNILTNPMHTASLFFTPASKPLTLVALLAPLFLLPLLSPISLLALPILVERFLSDRTNLWTTEFHYNAPVWVVLFFAAIDGLAKIRAHFANRGSTDAGGEGRTVRVFIAALASVPIAATVVFSSVSSGLFPLARMVTGAAWGWTGHMQDQLSAVSSIPPDSCVTADDRLVPHLTRTNRVAVAGVAAPVPDFYLIDLSQPAPGNPWPLQPWRDPTSFDVLETALHDGYRVVETFGTVIVLHNDAMSELRAVCSP